MSSADVQQWVRIMMYTVFGGLASAGVTTPDNIKTLAIGIVGFLATAAWTMYGTRLNVLLERVKAKTGVVGIEIKVDPSIIPPSNVTAATSPGIVATPASK